MYLDYSWLLNVTTMRKDPHACTIGWNIYSNKPHASPGLYNSNAFVVIKASPISSQKSHIVLNKPHASLFGQFIEMNKPSMQSKAIGCYIPQSRVPGWNFESVGSQQSSVSFACPPGSPTIYRAHRSGPLGLKQNISNFNKFQWGLRMSSIHFIRGQSKVYNTLFLTNKGQ